MYHNLKIYRGFGSPSNPVERASHPRPLANEVTREFYWLTDGGWQLRKVLYVQAVLVRQAL